MGLILLITILSSCLLTPLAMRAAWKCDAVSRPDGFRKTHARPTPEWGGLAVNAAILIGIGLSALVLPWPPASLPFAAALAVSVSMLCTLGCYDDLFDMRADLKLLGQFLAVLPVAFVGCSVERLSLLGLEVELGWLSVPWTVAWIVLGINALNLIDGMDGLASTMGITIAAAIAVIAGVAGNGQVMVLSLILAAALGGFLAHNLPPARIYLGDCGSMVVGLVLATLALQATAGSGTSNLTVLGALLFVPLADTLLAVVRRGLSGRGIMTADRGHVHHRLLDRGLGVWGSLAVLGGLSVAAGTLGCAVALTGHDAWACLFALPVAVVCVRRELFGHEEWQLVKSRVIRDGWRREASRVGRAIRRSFRPTVHTIEDSRMPHLAGKRIEHAQAEHGQFPLRSNARMAGAPTVSSARSGKQYVELLG